MCESRVSIPGFNATRVPRQKNDMFLLASRSKPIINIDRIAQVAQTQSSVTEGLPVPRAVQHYSLFNGRPTGSSWARKQGFVPDAVLYSK